MEDTIFVENFMLFHFDKRYFHIKINICGDITKIVFFSMISQLRAGGNAHARSSEVLVCLLGSRPQQSFQVSTLQQCFPLYTVFESNSPGSCSKKNFTENLSELENNTANKGMETVDIVNS